LIPTHEDHPNPITGQNGDMTSLSADEFAGLPDLNDWRYVLGAIHAEFGFGTYGAASEFVAQVGSAADAAEHHPDIALRYPGRVRVTLRTHAADALTELDVDLARTISSLAQQAQASSVPEHRQAVEIAIDTMDVDRIRPFWAAVLGYREIGSTNLVDPDRIGPPMWFQQMDRPRTERQRFHIDVSVPHEVAEARVAAALAAGGRLVTDQYARSWWVLADADGNEACVCTWQDRSPA
jgi:4a-hydroxytetrahydrobiopterin dehydratase